MITLSIEADSAGAQTYTPAQNLQSLLKQHLQHSEDLDLLDLIQTTVAPNILTQLEDFESAQKIHNYIRKVLAGVLMDELKENGVNLALTWGLGLLRYRGALLPMRNLQASDQIALLQALYLQFINKLLSRLKTQASFNREGISWLFEVTNQWWRHYEKIAQVGINKQSTISIKVPEPNIYAQENEDGHLNLMHILKALQVRDLPAITWRKLSAQEQFGGYLFFVICYSGVNYSKLQAIAHMSLLKKKLDAPFNSLLLPIDSSLKLANVYDQDALQSGKNQTHRWIPDPLSATIYKKLRKHWDFEPQGSQFNSQCIGLFIRYLKSVLTIQSASSKSSLSGGKILQLINALDFFKSTSSLISASKTYHSRLLPAFLWHYQQGHYESKDLGFPSLERLANIEIITKEIMPPARGRHEPHFFDESQSKTQVTIANQTHWAKSCLGAIDQFCKSEEQSAQDTIALLEKMRLELTLELGGDSLFALLIQWMQSLIHHAGEKNAMVLNYPKALLPPMVKMYELYADFSDLDAESRLEEYDDLEIESLYNQRDQDTLRCAWNSFHEYLISIKYIEAKQFIPIKRGSKQSKVDSEYISEPEFQLARETLYSKTNESIEFRNTCMMVMTLSYRLGLRRSEVTKLSSSHISFLSGVMQRLSVQWWPQRRIKTSSSNRLIPMKALLDDREALWLEIMAIARRRGLWITEALLHATQDELHAIRDKYAVHPINQTKNFLFLEDVNLIDPIKATADVDKIIKLIHWALRHPGGASEDLRFHHLRHSCATNTLLLLMSSHLPNSQQYILGTVFGNPKAIEKLNLLKNKSLKADYSNIKVQSQELSMRARKAREILLGGDESSSSEVYVVSCLLGHSSPMTTLASYIHVVDLLLGAHLNAHFWG
jgi:integrase